MAKITHNISNPNDGLGDQLRTGFGNQNLMNTELYENKVDKVTGKGLTENEFTNAEKAKLAGIPAGAEVNVQPDWAQNDNTADDYIKNKPAEMFSSVGSFHYVDLATKTTPLTVLAGVEKKITNDAADTETNVLNAPYGISSVYDMVASQLGFYQCSIGDLVTVIPAIEITTTVANQTFSIYLKMGIGSANPTAKQVYNGALAVVGSVIVNATRDFTIDTLDIKDYPAEIYILSNADATVKSGELDIRVVRKDINVIGSDPSKQNTLTAGTNITIDNTNPLAPVISAASGGATYDDTALVASVAGKEPANANIQLHIASDHAPSNAQKNSDITKAEIEAKLIGEITTHTHPAVGGGGDMVLATSQTVSGLKTFLNGMLGLRNVANTFTSFFTNANTASRTYTLPDRSGILADNTDLATKMNNPTGGIASYLPKFLTATTMGLSRLWDTGTFFGIGTANAPTKDLTFGNQGNREIGVEESNNTVVGRNLIIKAGRTINYVPNTNFNSLGITPRNYTGIAISTNNDVYLTCRGGDIYKQTGGTGAFVAQGVNKGFWCIAVSPNGDVYGGSVFGDIWKQTGGTGAFVAQGMPSLLWFDMTVSPSGDVYVLQHNTDIWKQTGGTGAFVSMGVGGFNGICASPSGDVWASKSNDLYKQTGGTGAFVAQGFTSLSYGKFTITQSNNIYAIVGTNIWKQTGGTGAFTNLGQASLDYYAIASKVNIWLTETNGDASIGNVYMQNNNFLGTANLDGGTYKIFAGTGKGTGKSRYEIYTGQKTVSGTDMQIETLREYIDENGYHVYASIPSYVNDAAADADTNLPNGAAYKITGNRTIFHKP